MSSVVFPFPQLPPMVVGKVVSIVSPEVLASASLPQTLATFQPHPTSLHWLMVPGAQLRRVDLNTKQPQHSVSSSLKYTSATEVEVHNDCPLDITGIMASEPSQTPAPPTWQDQAKIDNQRDLKVQFVLSVAFGLAALLGFCVSVSSLIKVEDKRLCRSSGQNGQHYTQLDARRSTPRPSSPSSRTPSLAGYRRCIRSSRSRSWPRQAWMLMRYGLANLELRSCDSMSKKSGLCFAKQGEGRVFSAGMKVLAGAFRAIPKEFAPNRCQS